MPEEILHITGQEDWQSAERSGSYRGDTLETQGFIHCATVPQLAWVARTWFLERTGLVVLHIAVQRVRSEIRYEPASHGELFPHIYGPLNVDAVVEVRPLEAYLDHSQDTQ